MATPLAGKRLLLASEDGDLSVLAAAAVRRLGADVEAVATGPAALAALARGPAVAVLDLPLPDIHSAELLAACAHHGVPAIAVSGALRGPRAEEEARRLGAVAFFEKPFPVEALAAAVAGVVGASAPPFDEEAHDEVTGSIPLVAGPSEIQTGPPRPALDEPPPRGAPAARDGFSTPLPSPPRQAPVREEPPPPSGDLARANVPRILTALHMGQATGALTLTRGPVKKILVVERGVPVYAASNLAAERFGALCVRRGLVPAQRLEALRAAAAPTTRTAEVLLAAGAITAAQRLELLRGLVRAVAWSTFEWREGDYAFQLGRPPAARVPLTVPMGNLVLEGILRTASLPRLREELPAGLHLAPSPSPAFELYALDLRGEDARLLASADGTKTVEDLVRLQDRPERDVLAALYACRVMRVLEPVERVLGSSRRIGFM